MVGKMAVARAAPAGAARPGRHQAAAICSSPACASQSSHHSCSRLETRDSCNNDHVRTAWLMACCMRLRRFDHESTKLALLFAQPMQCCTQNHTNIEHQGMQGWQQP